jgi:hypothetical protein
MLNLVQHLTKSRSYKLLKQVQGDKRGFSEISIFFLIMGRGLDIIYDLRNVGIALLRYQPPFQADLRKRSGKRCRAGGTYRATNDMDEGGVDRVIIRRVDLNRCASLVIKTG